MGTIGIPISDVHTDVDRRRVSFHDCLDYNKILEKETLKKRLLDTVDERYPRLLACPSCIHGLN